MYSLKKFKHLDNNYMLVQLDDKVKNNFLSSFLIGIDNKFLKLDTADLNESTDYYKNKLNDKVVKKFDGKKFNKLNKKHLTYLADLCKMNLVIFDLDKLDLKFSTDLNKKNKTVYLFKHGKKEYLLMKQNMRGMVSKLPVGIYEQFGGMVPKRSSPNVVNSSGQESAKRSRVPLNNESKMKLGNDDDDDDDDGYNSNIMDHVSQSSQSSSPSSSSTISDSSNENDTRIVRASSEEVLKWKKGILSDEKMKNASSAAEAKAKAKAVSKEWLSIINSIFKIDDDDYDYEQLNKDKAFGDDPPVVNDIKWNHPDYIPESAFYDVKKNPMVQDSDLPKKHIGGVASNTPDGIINSLLNDYENEAEADNYQDNIYEFAKKDSSHDFFQKFNNSVAGRLIIRDLGLGSVNETLFMTAMLEQFDDYIISIDKIDWLSAVGSGQEGNFITAHQDFFDSLLENFIYDMGSSKKFYEDLPDTADMSVKRLQNLTTIIDGQGSTSITQEEKDTTDVYLPVSPPGVDDFYNNIYQTVFSEVDFLPNNDNLKNISFLLRGVDPIFRFEYHLVNPDTFYFKISVKRGDGGRTDVIFNENDNSTFTINNLYRQILLVPNCDGQFRELFTALDIALNDSNFTDINNNNNNKALLQKKILLAFKLIGDRGQANCVKMLNRPPPPPAETLPTILLTDDRLAAVYAMLDIENETPVLYYKRSEQKLYVYNAIGKSKITIDPGSFNTNYDYFMNDWPPILKDAFNNFREIFIEREDVWRNELILTNDEWTSHLPDDPSKQNKIVNIRIIFINKLILAILDEIAKKDEETHRDYYDRIYVNTKFEHYLEHYYDFKGATTGRRVRDNQKQLNIIEKYKTYFKRKMDAYNAAITSAADDVVAAVNLDNLNFFNKINKRVVRSITTLNNQYLRKTKKYDREENWMNDYFDGGNTLHKCCIDSIRKFPRDQEQYTFVYRSTNGNYTSRDGEVGRTKEEIDIPSGTRLLTESMNPIERKYEKERAKATAPASLDFDIQASRRWIGDTKQELYDEEILKVFVHYYVFEKELLDGNPIGRNNRNGWNADLRERRARIINSTMDSMKEEYKREKEREFMVLLDNIKDSDPYYDVFIIQKDDDDDNVPRKLDGDEEKGKTKNLSSVHKFLNQPPINT